MRSCMARALVRCWAVASSPRSALANTCCAGSRPTCIEAHLHYIYSGGPCACGWCRMGCGCGQPPPHSFTAACAAQNPSTCMPASCLPPASASDATSVSCCLHACTPASTSVPALHACSMRGAVHACHALCAPVPVRPPAGYVGGGYADCLDTLARRHMHLHRAAQRVWEDHELGYV